MDLSKLSDAQLDRLEKVGGDVTQLSDDELDALEASQMTLGQKVKGAGKKALDYGMRGLDYAGGITRNLALTSADELAQMLGIYDEDRVHAGDTSELALAGKAPSTAEYMEMMKVPEGARVNLFPKVKVPLTDITLGDGDTSARDAAGFVGDVALDPTTYLTFGAASGVKGAGKVARPLAALESTVGEKIYQSGLKKADIIAKRMGKGEKALSETLLRNRVSGSAKQIAEKATAMADDLYKRQRQILAQGTAEGARIDAAKVLAPVQEKLRRIQHGRNTVPKEAAAKVGALIDDIVAPPLPNATFPGPRELALTPVEASEIKTSLRKMVGDSGYDTLRQTPDGKKLIKMTERQLRVGVEDSLKPALKSELKQVNRDLGTLLSSGRVLESEAGKEIQKNAFTSIDGILAINPKVLAAKKTADILKSTRLRTGLGKAMYYDKGVADTLLRRTNTMRGENTDE